MPRTIATAILLAALAAIPSPALAKDVTSATVCGPRECREVHDSRAVPFLAEGGEPTSPPSSAAPWYRATLNVEHEGARDRFTVVVVPDRRLLRGTEGDWMPISALAAAAYKKAMTDVEPFPADQLAGVPKGDAPGAADDDPAWWPVAAGALGLALLAMLAVALLRHRRPRSTSGRSARELTSSLR